MVDSKSPGPNGWYHKYGIYNSSGTNPEVKWRDVKFFHGPGTVPPPSVDGGRPATDAAAPDVAPPEEATGGSTGAADAAVSGSGGSGGQGGSDGGASSPADSARQPPKATGGSGGSVPEEPEPDPKPVTSPRSSGGCRAGGAESGDTSGQVLVLGLVLAAIVRRTRRAARP
jgi:hypothetical protein